MKPWLLAFGLAAILLPASAKAVEPPRGALDLIRDLRLTILARRALQRDDVLSKLNLGVEVRSGVAVAWGPIPDRRTGQRAVSRLEGINGIRLVRADFHFNRADPIAEPAFAARKVNVSLPAPPVVKPEKPAPVPVISASRGLAARIAAIRKTDARFAGIRAEVDGMSITVHRGDDEIAASLFAQRLQGLAGVEEVFLAAR